MALAPSLRRQLPILHRPSDLFTDLVHCFHRDRRWVFGEDVTQIVCSQLVCLSIAFSIQYSALRKLSSVGASSDKVGDTDRLEVSDQS